MLHPDVGPVDIETVDGAYPSPVTIVLSRYILLCGCDADNSRSSIKKRHESHLFLCCLIGAAVLHSVVLGAGTSLANDSV